jgi:hypothetical protein
MLVEGSAEKNPTKVEAEEKRRLQLLVRRTFAGKSSNKTSQSSSPYFRISFTTTKKK